MELEGMNVDKNGDVTLPLTTRLNDEMVEIMANCVVACTRKNEDGVEKQLNGRFTHTLLEAVQFECMARLVGDRLAERVEELGFPVTAKRIREKVPDWEADAREQIKEFNRLRKALGQVEVVTTNPTLN